MWASVFRLAARLALRPTKEQIAVSRVQTAYGEKYDPRMMADSRRDIAKLRKLGQETRSIREQLRQASKRQGKRHSAKERGQER